MTTQELLERQACGRSACICQKASARGHGLTHCPAHDDKTPSLAVKDEGGNPLWRCHAGCTQEAVTAAIGELTTAAAPAAKRIVAFYDYQDEQGELLYQVVRYRPKDFRQRKPTAGGGWDWSLNGVRRVLYHLPELAAAKPRRWVVLVEGEKDADRLREAGILATCYAGGVKAPWQKDWAEQLRGRRVVILPDADQPGLARARRDAAKLAGVCSELKVVALPGLAIREDHGEDVSDWLDQEHDVAELKRLVEAAPAFDPTLADPELSKVPAEPEIVDDPVKESTLVVRRLGELASLPGADLNWVAERFVAIGAVTDLTAFIKVGKSTLSSQLIAAILHGEPFLGEFKTAQSSVVLLTEEPAVSLLGELVDAGVEEEDPLHLVLWAENNGPTWPEITAQAATLCREVDARLLVIDTLSWWAGVEDEGDSGEARTAMRWLLHVASSGTAVLVLRQGRKQGGEIHNAGRGSGAYGGAADILLHLDYVHDEKGRAREESTRRLLRMKSRLEREQPLPMKLDYEHGLYHLLERPVRQVSLAERLHRLLLQRGKPATITELLAIMPTRKATMVATLRALVEEQLVERQGAGTHVSPFLYTALPVPGTTAAIPFPASVPEAGTDGNSYDAHASARAQTPGDAAPTGQLVPTPSERIRNASPPAAAPLGTATPKPAAPFLAAGGSENGAALTTDRRRVPCPSCSALPYTAGPDGAPQRRCHSCGHVWTPEPSTAQRSTR